MAKQAIETIGGGVGSIGRTVGKPTSFHPTSQADIVSHMLSPAAKTSNYGQSPEYRAWADSMRTDYMKRKIPVQRGLL